MKMNVHQLDTNRISSCSLWALCGDYMSIMSFQVYLDSFLWLSDMIWQPVSGLQEPLKKPYQSITSYLGILGCLPLCVSTLCMHARTEPIQIDSEHLSRFPEPPRTAPFSNPSIICLTTIIYILPFEFARTQEIKKPSDLFLLCLRLAPAFPVSLIHSSPQLFKMKSPLFNLFL